MSGSRSRPCGGGEGVGGEGGVGLGRDSQIRYHNVSVPDNHRVQYGVHLLRLITEIASENRSCGHHIKCTSRLRCTNIILVNSSRYHIMLNLSSQSNACN